jgi:capsular exopolysaccharide synthesis family protein
MHRPAEFSGQDIITCPPANRGAMGLLYLERIQSGAGDSDGLKPLIEYWYMLGRRLPLVIALIGVGSILGAVVSSLQVPMYQAKATIEIQNPSGSAINLHNIGDLEPARPTVDLPSQIKILQSRSLQERVRTKLQARFPQGFAVPRQSGWHAFFRSFRAAQPRAQTSALPPAKVKAQVVESTNLAEILCDSESPQFAATYANALTDEYIASNLEARWDSINRSREWLAHQLEDVRGELRKSEDQLQTYGRASQLMFTSDKDSIDQEKLKQIQEALSRAQAERIEKESIYKTAMSASPDSVPEVLKNGRLVGYQSQLAALEQQRAELSSQFTSEHYKVKRVQAQIEELEGTSLHERENVLKAIGNDYKSTLMRERLLTAAYRDQAKTFSQLTERAITYNILKGEVETNRQLYSSLLQKAKETDIASALHVSTVRIIDPAEAPRVPYKPNLLWNTLLGALAGFLVTVVGVVGRESLDRSFKAPGEVSVHLQLPELGVIPAGALMAGNRHGQPALSAVELMTWRDRQSYVAEAFRSLLISVLYSGKNGARPRVILVSSAIHGEGKSTVVSNLGVALADIEQRVLLIDADMHKPRLHEIFNMSNAWGLSDLLREQKPIKNSPLQALALPTEIVGLHVLPSGPCPTSVTNLLYSGRMSELLQRSRSEFDIVLIDTPPMLDISDARILGRLADAVVLVVRAGKTNREAAVAARRRLFNDGIPVLGAVLNAWDVKSSHYGYSRQYPYEA